MTDADTTPDYRPGRRDPSGMAATALLFGIMIGVTVGVMTERRNREKVARLIRKLKDQADKMNQKISEEYQSDEKDASVKK